MESTPSLRSPFALSDEPGAVAPERAPCAPGARTTRSRALGAFVLAAALAASAFTSGCGKKGETQATSESTGSKAGAAAPVSASFAAVVEKEVPQRLEVTGTLDADERAELAAQTMGNVLAVNVDLGTRVKKGDVLVELDGREAALRVTSANATAASQKARLGLEPGQKFDPDQVADVRAARDARDLARAEFERAKALFESNTISRAQYDQAASAKDRAEAGYESARNGASQAWSALVATQAQAGLSGKALEDTKIRAPFDGVIVEKRIAPGEFASVGRVVAVLVRDNPLRFRFEVPESAVASVALENQVDLRVAAYPEKTFRAVVKHLGGSLKVQTRTLPVEAHLANDDLTLRPGFFATATIQLGGAPQKVLFVPRAAAQPVGSGHRVFVKKGGVVQERLVVLGASEGELVEAKGQLAAGDEVAIDKLSELADGAAIAP